MNKETKSFLNLLSAVDKRIETIADQTFDYWHPNPPPPTSIYDEVGFVVSNIFNSLSVSARETICELLEDGMRSDNSELAGAIASGFVEGFTRDIGHEEWKRRAVYCGPSVRSYVAKWTTLDEDQ